MSEGVWGDDAEESQEQKKKELDKVEGESRRLRQTHYYEALD